MRTTVSKSWHFDAAHQLPNHDGKCRRLGAGVCRRAIAGAAYDPWVTQRKNGTLKRHDGWQLVFRDSGSLEDFANRAPKGDP